MKRFAWKIAVTSVLSMASAGVGLAIMPGVALANPPVTCVDTTGSVDCSPSNGSDSHPHGATVTNIFIAPNSYCHDVTTEKKFNGGCRQ